MNLIHIKYNEIEGYLNLDTGTVQFYQFNYSDICEAIKNVEHDLESYKEEIKLFNSLLTTLNI